MAQHVDRFLALLKWPFAFIALLFLPGAVIEIWDRMLEMATHATRYPSFLLGILAYIGAWLLWFRKRIWGSAFSTLEHELTHALFGLLTFRIIRGIKISWSGGGHVRFKGAANWAIFIAPYWFPTLTVAMVPVIFFVEDLQVQTAMAVLGATVGYHLCSTWNEVHPGQSDLKKVGFLFSLATLPFLNLLSYGSILSYMMDGWTGISRFIAAIFSRPLDWAQFIT